MIPPAFDMVRFLTTRHRFRASNELSLTESSVFESESVILSDFSERKIVPKNDDNIKAQKSTRNLRQSRFPYEHTGMSLNNWRLIGDDIQT